MRHRPVREAASRRRALVLCLVPLLLLPSRELVAAPARPLEVSGNRRAELKVHGALHLATPAAPLELRVSGPARLALDLVPAAQGGGTESPLSVRVLSAGTALFEQTVSVATVPGLMAQSRGRTPFAAAGVRRIQLPPVPEGLHTYRLEVDRPTAVGAWRKAGGGPEEPVPPTGRPPAVQVRAEDDWHWLTVCEPLSLTVAQPGTLTLRARLKLDPQGDLPPPSFVRLLRGGRELSTLAVTAGPEQGLSLQVGEATGVASTARTARVRVAEPGTYRVELAAWGCVQGVALLLEHQTQPLPAPSTATDDGAAPSRGVALTPQELARCQVALDAQVRRRAQEYVETLVAAAVIPGSELALHHASALAPELRLHELSYALDGEELFPRSRPPTEGGATLTRALVPGTHLLQVQLVFGPARTAERHSLTRQVPFVAVSGKRAQLRVSVTDTGHGAWRERVSLSAQADGDAP